jgi:type II secretory pathway component GspD/PulD (secretin)
MTPNKLLPSGQTATETTSNVSTGGGMTETDKALFPQIRAFPYVGTDEFKYGTIDFSQFTAMMKMLKSRSNTKIISNPRIVVIDHQEARVQAGREIGLPTFERNETTGSLEITGYQARNDGIELKVTPHVAEKSEILLTVRPELTRFIGFKPVVVGSNVLSPEFDTTVAETQVIVHSGDTLVIGGLISDLEADQQKGVPYLSKIPFAGWLFKNVSPNTDKSETIIFVSVTLADDVFNRKALEDWHAKQEEYEAFRKQSEGEFSRKRDDKEEQDKQKKQSKEDAKKSKPAKKRFFWQKKEAPIVVEIKEESKVSVAPVEVVTPTAVPSKVEEPVATEPGGNPSPNEPSAAIKESAADAAEQVAAMIEESKNNPR